MAIVLNIDKMHNIIFEKYKIRKKNNSGNIITYPCRIYLCLGHQSLQQDLQYWGDSTFSLWIPISNTKKGQGIGYCRR
jgi:hypothetical protein